MFLNQRKVIVLVRLKYDDEARVWYGVGENLPGLIAEAETMDELRTLLKDLIPEAIKLNGLPKELDDLASGEEFWTLPVPPGAIYGGGQNVTWC